MQTFVNILQLQAKKLTAFPSLSTTLDLTSQKEKNAQ